MAEIRSVSVHLDADVASYIAKMRLVGAETDKAFGRSNTGIQSTNTALGETESTLGRIDRTAVRADSSLRRVESTMSRGSSGQGGFTKAALAVDKFAGGLSGIPTLAIAGTAALIPLAAAGAGVAAAFAAPIAFVGGGLTLFGLLGGAAIKETDKQYKAITALEKKLAGLKKGTAEYVQVQKQLHDANAAISPQQQAFHNQLQTLEGDFKQFIAGPAGRDLLGPFTQGLKVADDLLPHAGPIIHAVAGDLDTLLGELDRYSRSRGFQHLVHDISAQIGPDLLQGGHFLGDVVDGVSHLLVLSGKKLSPDVLHWVGQIGQDFDHWASSKQGRHDVEKFFDYVHQVGPQVGDDLEAVAKAGGHLVTALAPLGPPVLRTIKGIADAISGIPAPVLTALAGGVLATGVAQRVGVFKGASHLPGVLRVGQNIASELTGGLIPGASSKYGRGVQPVYVTNPGFGSGGPGGGGGGGGFVGRVGKKILSKPTGVTVGGEAETIGSLIGGAVGVTGLTLIATGVVYGTIKEFQFGAGTTPDTKHPSGANLTPDGYRQYNDRRLNSPTGLIGSEKVTPFIKATGTAVDALNAKLGRASRNLDLVGHSAHRAFDGATTDAAHLTSRIDRINTGKASASLDLFGTAAQRDFLKVGGEVDNLQHKVNRPLHVDVETAAANAKIAETDRSMTALAHHRVDPTVNVETSQAEAALRRVYADLALIRSKTITVTTNRVTGGHSTAGNAAGGYITGPGGPTSDSIPAWLSNGEYVMRAAAVNRYGVHMMHRLNALAYAGGGAAGTPTTTGSQQHPDPVARRLTDTINHLQKSLAGVNKQLDLEIAQRQRLVQARAQLVQTVTSGFRSQIFGVQPAAGIWGAGATSDPAQILRGDIRGARQYTRDLRLLRRRGLRGGALAQVTTLADAQQALGLSAAEDREITRLYAVRQRASAAAGARAGDYRYGKQIAGITSEIKGLRADVRRETQEIASLRKEQHQHAKAIGDQVAKGVNNGVRNGVRRGSKP